MDLAQKKMNLRPDKIYIKLQTLKELPDRIILLFAFGFSSCS